MATAPVQHRSNTRVIKQHTHLNIRSSPTHTKTGQHAAVRVPCRDGIAIKCAAARAAMLYGLLYNRRMITPFLPHFSKSPFIFLPSVFHESRHAGISSPRRFHPGHAFQGDASNRIQDSRRCDDAPQREDGLGVIPHAAEHVFPFALRPRCAAGADAGLLPFHGAIPRAGFTKHGRFVIISIEQKTDALARRARVLNAVFLPRRL